MNRRGGLFAMALFSVAGVAFAQSPPAALDVPGDFPRFRVPGYEKEMNALRELFWLHYPHAGPKATLWDEWLAFATLWPAVETANRMESIRDQWRMALSRRIIDPEGYVSTHQHASIAHPFGWPFPFWAQGADTWGWHFAIPGLPSNWHGTQERTQEGWTLTRAKDLGIAEQAWNIELTGPDAIVAPPTDAAPAIHIDAFQAPFLQLRWRATGLGNAQPCVEWTTAEAPEFSAERRFYFPPVELKPVGYTMIPVYQHPLWKGRVTALRIAFNNAAPGAKIGIQSFFTQYDTRHNVNNLCFPRGCMIYFNWTRDINFLREHVQRIRLAARYAMTEFHALDEKCIATPFVGHDGRSGLERTPDGKKKHLYGHGIGSNYWDLLPTGYKDFYATVQYYDMIRMLATLERQIAAHPEWSIPGGPTALDPAFLDRHAEEVKQHSGQLFWNPQTERFVLGFDAEGKSYDYGYTFVNLEAIHYGLATPEQARAILSWISGERIVDGDTSTGSDIYHWRFGPRSSTKRNVDWYGWFWTNPESIPWGGQVQDGGAVLGFSYYDLMSRLKVRGPDDAWTRLREIITWFDEVQAGGGYRAYYKDPERGTLQGGGVAGGLGLDREFVESVLVPQVMLYGFLGFAPSPTGFAIDPRLPKDWPELTLDRVHLHRTVLSLRVTPKSIEVARKGAPWPGFAVTAPPGPWNVEYLGADGTAVRTRRIPESGEGSASTIEWADGPGLRLARP